MQPNFNFQRYTNIPFPERKYLPGESIHPSKHPEGSHIPEVPSDMTTFDIDTWRHSQPYLYAIDLFNFGYWWEAHEVLEDLWVQTGKTTVIAKFIQGIIQISAALLKDSQSVPIGASRLVARGLPKLRLRSGIFLGVNVEDFGRDVERYFAGERSLPPQIMLRGLKV